MAAVTKKETSSFRDRGDEWRQLVKDAVDAFCENQCKEKVCAGVPVRDLKLHKDAEYRDFVDANPQLEGEFPDDIKGWDASFLKKVLLKGRAFHTALHLNPIRLEHDEDVKGEVKRVRTIKKMVMAYSPSASLERLIDYLFLGPHYTHAFEKRTLHALLTCSVKVVGTVGIPDGVLPPMAVQAVTSSVYNQKGTKVLYPTKHIICSKFPDSSIQSPMVAGVQSMACADSFEGGPLITAQDIRDGKPVNVIKNLAFRNPLVGVGLRARSLKIPLEELLKKDDKEEKPAKYVHVKLHSGAFDPKDAATEVDDVDDEASRFVAWIARTFWPLFAKEWSEHMENKRFAELAVARKEHRYGVFTNVPLYATDEAKTKHGIVLHRDLFNMIMDEILTRTESDVLDGISSNHGVGVQIRPIGGTLKQASAALIAKGLDDNVSPLTGMPMPSNIFFHVTWQVLPAELSSRPGASFYRPHMKEEEYACFRKWQDGLDECILEHASRDDLRRRELDAIVVGDLQNMQPKKDEPPATTTTSKRRIEVRQVPTRPVVTLIKNGADSVDDNAPLETSGEQIAQWMKPIMD